MMQQWLELFNGPRETASAERRRVQREWEEKAARKKKFHESFPKVEGWMQELDSDAEELQQLARFISARAEAAVENIKDVKAQYCEILAMLGLPEASTSAERAQGNGRATEAGPSRLGFTQAQ